MKKALLAIYLSLALCLNFPCVTFAQEPTKPDLEGKSNEEAAALVNEYNAQVDAYNQQVDKDYEQAVNEYEEALAYNEEAKKHNAQEDATVAEVNEANAAEQARVDAANEELQNNYNKELEAYNSKIGNGTGLGAEGQKYVTRTEGKTTYYYDNDGNLLYKSVAGDTEKKDIVTYENVGTNEKPKWSSTYDYSGKNQRYVNFSIISVIGKTTTGTDWDNDASKYSNKVYSTIANKNNVSNVPLDFNDEGEGRNLINYLTEVNGEPIGLEQCDTMIRNLATTAIDTYFNKANGNEAAGAKKMDISFVDFPSTATVFKNLQTNGSAFTDPDTGEKITGEAINEEEYTLRWFSVKYQANGWRVSGVLLKNGVVVPPAEPDYLVANLRSYSPQYIALKEAVAPTRGNYISYFVYTPDTQEEESVAPATQDEDVPAPAAQGENAVNPTAQEGDNVVLAAQAEDDVVPAVQAGEVAAPAAQAGAAAAPAAQGGEGVAATNALPQNAPAAIGEQPYVAEAETPAAEAIADDETPLAEAIADGETPLASGISSDEPTGSWALLNLIFMLFNIVILLMVPRNKEEEDSEVQYRTNALGIALAIAATLVFILTQNVHLPMVIADQWTLLMAAFAAGGVVTKVFSRKRVEE